MTQTAVPTEAFAAAAEATERATQQARELGEQAVAASRGYAQLALDTYEQTVAGLIELERKAAEAAPADWVKTAIGAHVAMVKDINDAYVKAVRDALA